MMQDLIVDIRETLQRGGFLNETHIRTGIVDPILASLGWSHSKGFVTPEFRVESGRVDIALLNNDRDPTVFIETKQPGRDGGAEAQLFRYASEVSVDIAVLTTGKDWWFYFPTGRGTYRDRQFCSISFINNSPAEVQNVLETYLAFERVQSGAATTSAREAQIDVVVRKRLEKELPRIWNEIIESADPRLVGLITERLKAESNIEGYEDEIRGFVRNLGSTSIRPTIASPYAGRPSTATPHVESTRTDRGTESVSDFSIKPQSTGKTIKWIKVFGARYETPGGTRQALKLVLTVLNQRDGDFLNELHHAYPSFISTSREAFRNPTTGQMKPGIQELNPGSGWWLNLNLSTDSVISRMKQSCRVAGVSFGIDVEFEVV